MIGQRCHMMHILTPSVWNAKHMIASDKLDVKHPLWGVGTVCLISRANLRRDLALLPVRRCLFTPSIIFFRLPNPPMRWQPVCAFALSSQWGLRAQAGGGRGGRVSRSVEYPYHQYPPNLRTFPERLHSNPFYSRRVPEEQVTNSKVVTAQEQAFLFGLIFRIPLWRWRII